MSVFMTVGILTRGLVSTEWAFSLRELGLPKETLLKKSPGLPFDHARNEMVKAALKNGSQWLFFLDDDVLPPQDTLAKLFELKAEVCSGVYWKRQGNIAPAAYYAAKPNPTPLPAITGDQPIVVDYVGAGCLLVHRSVFEAIKPPWFQWKIDREDLPAAERLGEDFDFCQKVTKAGFRIILHQGVRCRHTGYGWSNEEGKFVPEPPTSLL